MPDIAVTRSVAAAPSAVWDIVTDPTRMGEWSPENTGAKWIGGATRATAGAQFRGSNKNGWVRWRTKCTITECVANSVYSFDVVYGPVPISRWSYRLEASDGATVVTEEWTNRTWPPLSKLLNRMIGVRSRAEFSRSSMETTLAAIAAHVEPAGRVDS